MQSCPPGAHGQPKGDRCSTNQRCGGVGAAGDTEEGAEHGRSQGAWHTGYSRATSDAMPSEQRQEVIQIRKCAWHVRGTIVTGTEECDSVEQEVGG